MRNKVTREIKKQYNPITAVWRKKMLKFAVLLRTVAKRTNTDENIIFL